MRLNYRAGSYPLIISVASRSDTTLVVNGPDGSWYCDDDGGNYGLNSGPALRLADIGPVRHLDRHLRQRLIRPPSSISPSWTARPDKPGRRGYRSGRGRGLPGPCSFRAGLLTPRPLMRSWRNW